MKKENLPLVLGLLIPVLMILFVVVSIYVPAFLTQPKCKFLYAASGSYYDLESYAVEGGQLVKKEVKYPPQYNARTLTEPKLFVCDVTYNSTSEISFEDAQKLRLSSGRLSPDGFEVSTGSQDYSIFSLFFSRSSYYGDKYIHGHGVSKRLNLHRDDNYGFYNFHFIGWVL